MISIMGVAEVKYTLCLFLWAVFAALTGLIFLTAFFLFAAQAQTAGCNHERSQC